MAKPNDTSKSRSGRNRLTANAKSASRLKIPAGFPNLDALEDMIETERARLMQAHSILDCVAIAMDADDICPSDGPHYPTLIEAARDLINDSINRLDGVNLDRVMQRKGDEEKSEKGKGDGPVGSLSVKEPSPAYLASLDGCRLTIT